MSDAPPTTPTRTPTLTEAIRVGVAAGLVETFVAIVGHVEKWNGNERTADVRPLVRDFARDEDGAKVDVTMPTIPRVPVHVLGGAGYSFRFPIKPGDECLIVFCDRSIDAWQTGGGEQDPVDERRHHYADAVAIVGLRNIQSALAAAPWPTDRLAVGSETGGALVELTEAGHVVLNGGGAGVARVGDGVAPSADMTTWMAAVSAALTGLGVPTSPPPTFAEVAQGSTTVEAGG